jgi:hypothetical protein
MLNFFAAAGERDFKQKIVGASVVGSGAIIGGESRDIDRPTLLAIRRLERGAPAAGPKYNPTGC